MNSLLNPLQLLHKKLLATLTLVFFLALTFHQALAQDSHTDTGVKHGLGFSGGYILGTGLTYVHYLGPHMIQASFIGDVDQNKTDYKAGLSYARYLHHVTEPRSMLPVALKFVIGMDVHYQDGYVNSDVIVYDNIVTDNEYATYFFHAGAGLGIDIGNPAKPGLVLSLLITYALSLEEVNKTREWEISPLPAIGILYNW
ncbi:MAG: hypothetical protein R3240_05055 [Gammaproteobacteria bacterium]|nr:hypothetical protein [Gammaproteobacteria bacterium]